MHVVASFWAPAVDTTTTTTTTITSAAVVAAALENFATLMATKPLDSDLVKDAAQTLCALVGEEGYGDALGVVAFFAYVTRVVDATGHTSSVVEAMTFLSRYAPSSRTMKGMFLMGIAVATVAMVIKKYHR